MKKTYYSILGIGIILMSCGSSKDEIKNAKSEEVEETIDDTEFYDEQDNYADELSDESVYVDKRTAVYKGKYLISTGKAGEFNEGDDLPKKGQRGDYLISMVKTKYAGESEDEPDIRTVYKVSEDGEYTLWLGPDIWGEDESKIGDITVYSDKYRTALNIGVGSSLYDFNEQYSSDEIWYSEVYECFIFESTRIEAVQFFVNEKFYIGEETEYFEELGYEITDFNVDGIIHAVRVY